MCRRNKEKEGYLFFFSFFRVCGKSVVISTVAKEEGVFWPFVHGGLLGIGALLKGGGAPKNSDCASPARMRTPI